MENDKILTFIHSLQASIGRASLDEAQVILDLFESLIKMENSHVFSNDK